MEVFMEGCFLWQENLYFSAVFGILMCNNLGRCAMDGLRSFLANFDFGQLGVLVLSAIATLLCLTVHELCHGLAAYLLGDSTAKRAVSSLYGWQSTRISCSIPLSRSSTASS